MLPERLRELTGIELGELAGSSLEGEIPLRDEVVTRLARHHLPASGPITDIHIETQDANGLTVLLLMRGSRLLPQVRIAATIEKQPEFPDAPVLGLRWSVPGLGPLAMLAAPALAFFKALPPGIAVDGDRIAVDIAQLLRSRGLEEILPLITRLLVTTRRGAVVVGFAVRVE